MGLDMFLFTCKKVSSNEELRTIEEITEVAYWRKFNALHLWFVKNIQNKNDDCANYLVTKEDLEQLLELLNKLTKNNCHQLLPTTKGFFFGSTEYDKWYWESVENTKDQINTVLTQTDFEQESVFYNSSW